MVQTSNYIESKYHSLYIITGLIMSKYDIDAYNLKITRIGEIDKIFIEWFCKKHEVYAYEMPGKRYDIGNMESLEWIRENY